MFPDDIEFTTRDSHWRNFSAEEAAQDASRLAASEREKIREWNEAAVEGECQQCGARRPVQALVDPFVNEGIIEGKGGEDDVEHWCFECFRQRCNDV